MNAEIKTWLYDILNAISEIDSFFTASTRDFFAYQNDLKTKRAVERNIEIIGEAVNRIVSHNDNSIQLSNSRKIIDTRNRIIHGYDTVSDDIIWGIITKYLPPLRSEIVHLLGNG